MTLVSIVVLIAVAALLGYVSNERWRVNLLLAVSALAVFALQPTLPVRGLDFYLPTFTLLFCVLAWIITTPVEMRSWHTNWVSVLLLGGIVLALGLTRGLGFSLPLTASRPPQTLAIVLFLAVAVVIAFLLTRFSKPSKVILTAGFVLVIFLFVFLKVPRLTMVLSQFLRSLNGQALAMASPLDVRWLGFSYIAFRILHTIRDRQNGRLPAVSLSEYVVYLIFFPALSAGPIDRIDRFVSDLRHANKRTADDWGEAGKRLVIGLFKKFVIADGLALISLNTANSQQVHSAGWAWILLYAYAFQLYFDFSGYTDIAIGMARLLGIKLPENFNAPFLKSNLTQFWNNWHMTLTQWFRAYFFNPVTRALRSGKKPLSIPTIIFITQVATMVLIGLWHGVNWNFVAWGLWHGIGLFIHNRWSERTKARFTALKPRWQKILNVGGALLTFHFVGIGWVFFTLPQLPDSFHFLQVLFGVA